MTDQVFIGVSRDDDIDTVEDALDAVREEHDAPDASNAAAITQICAAYVGLGGPLGEPEHADDVDVTVDGDLEGTAFRYERQAIDRVGDIETVDLPDNARGVTVETFADDAHIRYLVPVQGGNA